MADLAEHPEATEIRRQVEFYFSDENLPDDMFLKVKMQESGNGTIKLKEILKFPKMRRYKPKTAVILALRQSPFLHISSDDEFISRRVPFIWPDSDIDNDYEEKEAVWKAKHQNAQQGKKKPVAVGMAAKLATGMDKPTGFEDSFVDGPVTPAEWAEERQTYDPEESIHERLAIAIHRYSTRRKFHQNYALIFNSFMKFGGVEARGGDFQGGAIKDEELEDYDPGQIAQLKSTFDIGHDKDPGEGVWALDFVGVAKGFLSSSLPLLVQAREYPLALRILTNFYNYLLVHDVFHAEQEADIVASIQACIRLCDLAGKELPKVDRAGRELPGAFNVAASVLSAGFHRGLWAGDEDWAKTTGENFYGDEVWGSGGTTGMCTGVAKVVLSMGITAHGNDEMFEAMHPLEGRLRCVETREFVGLEVKEIILAPREACEVYAGDETVRKKLDLQVTGQLKCEEWEMPSFQTWDLPLDDESRLTKPMAYTFEVEEDILKSMFPGMKLEATLRNLALGLGQGAPTFWTIDTVSRTYCSFYTYLPNELMTKPAKAIRWLTNDEGEGDEDGKAPLQDEESF